MIDCPVAFYAQSSSKAAVPNAPPGQGPIDVVYLQAIGAGQVQAISMSDRLREELLKTCRYIRVEPERLDVVWQGQAFQQTGRIPRNGR